MKERAATRSNTRTALKRKSLIGAVRVVVRVAAKLYRLMHCRKGGGVSRINARRVTETSCALSGPALRIFLDVIYDVVRAFGISRYTTHSC